MEDANNVLSVEALDLLLVMSRRASQFVKDYGNEVERREHQPEQVFARLCLEIFCSLDRLLPLAQVRELFASVAKYQSSEDRLTSIIAALYGLPDHHRHFAKFSLIILHRWVKVVSVDLMPLENELQLYIDAHEALTTDPEAMEY